MPETDYYQVLGLELNATRSQIRGAFRVLAMRFHPDQNPGNPTAEEKFKLITQAYKTLIDPKKRAHYDRTRQATQSQRLRAAGRHRRHAPGGSTPTSATASREETTATETEQKQKKRPWWEGVTDKPKPAPPKPEPPKPQRGSDLEVTMTISSQTAELGGRQALAISRLVPCSTCEGTCAKPGTTVRRCPECRPKQPSSSCVYCSGRGWLIEALCPTCKGSGKEQLSRTVLVNVPKMTREGQLLRMPGEGLPGTKGGKPGDLLVRLRVKPGFEYEQHDAAVYSEVHVTPALAAMGGTVRVRTLDGTEDLAIPPATKSGTVIRLEGKGPVLEGNERGDHYVTVNIVVP
jgi:molecular chaperone DnaJ